ncbi:hypothetical protein F1643_18210 [Azospirillum sp. INR13]|uniref:hypothetical protein n=1 Tax=Azospirillum sp. INR13 TaxID=2596919 RepID=UPI0018926B3D|nr:hypothetical protein [Azospirillum sp. INR13]MBF5096025.1 hypothetical protein [Azospirillum sp. INR13]
MQTGNLVSLHDGSAANFLRLLISAGSLSYDITAAGASQGSLPGGAVVAGMPKRVAITWRAGSFAISAQGAGACYGGLWRGA